MDNKSNVNSNNHSKKQKMIRVDEIDFEGLFKNYMQPQLGHIILMTFVTVLIFNVILLYTKLKWGNELGLRNAYSWIYKAVLLSVAILATLILFKAFSYIPSAPENKIIEQSLRVNSIRESHNN